MSDDEMRIAVAECCGWTKTRTAGGYLFFFPPGFHLKYECAVGLGTVGGGALPNYPADLNACAEIEKTLSEDEYTEYEETVWDIQLDAAGIAKVGSITFPDRIRGISATARQRCEAFLKVKGLWTT